MEISYLYRKKSVWIEIVSLIGALFITFLSLSLAFVYEANPNGINKPLFGALIVSYFLLVVAMLFAKRFNNGFIGGNVKLAKQREKEIAVIEETIKKIKGQGEELR